MRKIIIIVCAGLLGVTNANSKSLCLKTEQKYFSCNIGEKIASYCGGNEKYLVYRFGSNKKIEMSYEASTNNGKHIYHTIIGNDIIFFNINNYYYNLSIPMKGEPVLSIKKNKILLKEYVCKNSTEFQMNNNFLQGIGREEIEDISNIY